MRSLFVNIANLLNHHTYLVAGGMAVLILISLFGMTNLVMETGDDTYLDKTTPEGILLNKYTEDFSTETLILLVEGGNPTSPEVISYLDTISPALGNLQHVSSVSSIATVLKEANNGFLPRSTEEVSQVTSQIPKQTIGSLVPSGMMAVMYIKLDAGLSDDKKQSVMDNIRSFVKSTEPPSGITLTLTGGAVFMQEMEDAMSESMGVLIIGALVLMIIVLGLLFAYVSYRFLPVLMVFVGLILTFGIMGLFGIPITMTVIAAFPVLIGLGIDYAIQFHARLDEQARTHTLSEAIFITITNTGPAVFFAMIATTMGFFAMFVSPVPMIQSFGLVSIIGVVLCYLTSLMGIPIMARFLQYKPKKTDGKDWGQKVDRALSKTAVVIAKKPLAILFVAVIIAMVGIQVDSSIPISTNERDFVPIDMPAKITLDKITRTTGSTEPAPVILTGDTVLSVDTLVWMQSYQDLELRKYQQITGVNSILDYLKAYNNGILPGTEAELNRVLNLIPESLKDQYINGKNEALISFSTVELEMTQQNDLKKQMMKDIALFPPPPGIQAKVTGNFDLFSTMITTITESKETMTYLGFLFVVLCLALIYRNSYAVTPIVPIICIVGWNAVAMTILGVDYSVMTACLGSMTIGIGAEYTILIMERFLEEKKKTPDVIEAIQVSVRKIGSAILVSGLATFFGFSALLLADFPIISNFGLLTVIAVLFSLIGAIFIMPAILSALDSLVHFIKGPGHQTRQTEHDELAGYVPEAR